MNILDGAYKINLDKLFKYVFRSESNEKIEREITDGFQMDNESKTIEQVTKIVREIKGRGDNNSDTLRYDIIKSLLFEIIDTDDEALGSTGIKLCFNTLLAHGILEEYDEYDE